MKPQLYYEIKPFIVNQPWGVHRPEVYAQFGFEDHNGIDVAIAPGALVRAPLNAQVINISFQPHGGGLFLSILSENEFDFPDGKRAKILFDYLHLKETIAKVGDKVILGQQLAIQDNTGFTTGPHTHIQNRRVVKTPTGLNDVDSNAAHNSFDPTPYYTGGYAYDHAIIPLYQQLIPKLKELVALSKPK